MYVKKNHPKMLDIWSLLGSFYKKNGDYKPGQGLQIGAEYSSCDYRCAKNDVGKVILERQKSLIYCHHVIIDLLSSCIRSLIHT